jgi:hypothetical protein
MPVPAPVMTTIEPDSGLITPRTGEPVAPLALEYPAADILWQLVDESHILRRLVGLL